MLCVVIMHIFQVRRSYREAGAGKVGGCLMFKMVFEIMLVAFINDVQYATLALKML